MAIQNLDNVDSISNSTLFAVNQNGLDYNCTGLAVANFIEQNISLNDNSVIQYAAPLTGSTVAVSGTGDSVWLVLTPASSLAALTVQLPLVDGCVANQEVLIVTTQTIAALTISLNGASASGLPSALIAGGVLRLRFEPVLKTWYNVTGPNVIYGSASWNPGTIANGGIAGTNVVVTGAALGDFVDVAFSASQQDCLFQGWVSTADVVRVLIVNNSGVSKTFSSGTIKVKISK